MTTTSRTSRIIFTLSSAALLATFGCATQQVKTARSLEVIDSGPADSAKGYVEFYSESRDSVVVPVFLLDEQRHPHLLAATGLRAGESYSYRMHHTITAARLRIALSAGRHQFMVEKDGQILQVPVEAGKVTVVEFDYGLIYRGISSTIYSPSFRVFEPAPFEAERHSG